MNRICNHRIRSNIVCERSGALGRNLGLLVALCGMVLFCPSCQGAGEKGEAAKSGSRRGKAQSVVVEVAVARVDSFTVHGDYAGEFLPARQAYLSAQVGGRLSHVSAHVGDWVEEGQVLASVEDLPYRQRVRELSAAVQMGAASLAEARLHVQRLKAESDRKKPLLERELISEWDAENLEVSIHAAQIKVDVAQANLEGARARLLTAREDLRNTQIRAPFGGIISARHFDQGSHVNPNGPVYTIIDNERPYLIIRVPERDAGLMRVGLPVVIRVTSIEHLLPGEVIRIAPNLEPSSRTLRVDVRTIDDATSIKPGMYARVKAELEKVENKVVIPRQALLRERDGTPFLWLVEDDKAKKRAVVLGLSNPEWVEIVEGIAADTPVVLRGYERLIPDVRVEVMHTGALEQFQESEAPQRGNDS